jgi:hypothetical protein
MVSSNVTATDPPPGKRRKNLSGLLVPYSPDKYQNYQKENENTSEAMPQKKRKMPINFKKPEEKAPEMMSLKSVAWVDASKKFDATLIKRRKGSSRDITDIHLPVYRAAFSRRVADDGGSEKSVSPVKPSTKSVQKSAGDTSSSAADRVATKPKTVRNESGSKANDSSCSSPVKRSRPVTTQFLPGVKKRRAVDAVRSSIRDGATTMHIILVQFTAPVVRREMRLSFVF